MPRPLLTLHLNALLGVFVGPERSPSCSGPFKDRSSLGMRETLTPHLWSLVFEGRSLDEPVSQSRVGFVCSLEEL